MQEYLVDIRNSLKARKKSAKTEDPKPKNPGKEDLTRVDRMNTKQRPGTPPRDLKLQKQCLGWLLEVTDDEPNAKADYDHWIMDGTVLVKVLQYCMFNSVPLDLVKPVEESLTSKEERLRILIKYLRKYGVPEEYLFDEDDLFKLKDIPKVTRCIAMLGKMSNAPGFEDLDLNASLQDMLMAASK